jgi:hypothetical protein
VSTKRVRTSKYGCQTEVSNVEEEEEEEDDDDGEEERATSNSMQRMS